MCSEDGRKCHKPQNANSPLNLEETKKKILPGACRKNSTALPTLSF
jgi:hypothetical protein